MIGAPIFTIALATVLSITQSLTSDAALSFSETCDVECLHIFFARESREDSERGTTAMPRDPFAVN